MTIFSRTDFGSIEKCPHTWCFLNDCFEVFIYSRTTDLILNVLYLSSLSDCGHIVQCKSLIDYILIVVVVVLQQSTWRLTKQVCALKTHNYCTIMRQSHSWSNPKLIDLDVIQIDGCDWFRKHCPLSQLAYQYLIGTTLEKAWWGWGKLGLANGEEEQAEAGLGLAVKHKSCFGLWSPTWSCSTHLWSRVAPLRSPWLSLGEEMIVPSLEEVLAAAVTLARGSGCCFGTAAHTGAWQHRTGLSDSLICFDYPCERIIKEKMLLNQQQK